MAMLKLAPKGLTVILVEDDLALRLALAFRLEQEGFIVQAHADGQALLAATPPSGRACLVIDYFLKGMSGIEALKALRRAGFLLPAVVITADPTTRMRAEIAALGAAFVEQPLLGDTVVDAISSVLAS